MADSCQCMTRTTTILWSKWPPTGKNKSKKKKRLSKIKILLWQILKVWLPSDAVEYTPIIPQYWTVRLEKVHSEESSKTRTEIYLGDVPGGPVPSSAGGEDSVPGWRAKIPHASWPKNQNMKNRSNIVTNSIKTLKWSTFFLKNYL